MPYYDISLSDGYIDLVFEGHTHQYYIATDNKGVYHLQGGGENKYISCADVELNITDNTYSIVPKLINKSEYAKTSIDGDPIVEEIFNKYFPNDNPYTTIIGRNRTSRNSTELCEKVAELYLDIGQQEWGGQYNIVIGGGFLNTRSPYSLSSGNITYAMLFSLMPFDNTIVLGKILGENLKNLFDKDRYYLASELDYYEYVDSQYYYIVVDTYTSTYRYNNIIEVARLPEVGYARDLIAEFIAEGGWA